MNVATSTHELERTVFRQTANAFIILKERKSLGCFEMFGLLELVYESLTQIRPLQLVSPSSTQINPL